MVEYSNSDLTDMHFFYGRANGNGREAQRLYQEAFPNRPQPSFKIFGRLHARLSENGSFKSNLNGQGRPSVVATPQLEVRVLNLVEENPSLSSRRIARQVGVRSHATILRILHSQQLYPYHIQRVQALLPGDNERRIEMCAWFQDKMRNNEDFLPKVLFTDEASFTRDGINNFHNNHVWADENPHATFESRHQQRFSVNVWAGIFADRLIGPYVLPNRLSGASYLQFIRDTLPELLDEIPLEDRTSMWFMHDGAPAHFELNVRAELDRKFQENWIGRGGPVPWPARSPDLNPLDYYLWGHLKSLVYSVPIENVDQLRERVFNCCQEIRELPGIFERVRSSFVRRMECCILMNGDHIEHIL
jgi:hypothetical protein